MKALIISGGKSLGEADTAVTRHSGGDRGWRSALGRPEGALGVQKRNRAGAAPQAWTGTVGRQRQPAGFGEGDKRPGGPREDTRWRPLTGHRPHAHTPPPSATPRVDSTCSRLLACARQPGARSRERLQARGGRDGMWSRGLRTGLPLCPVDCARGPSRGDQPRRAGRSAPDEALPSKSPGRTLLPH